MQLVFPGILDFGVKRAYARFLVGALRLRKLRLTLTIVRLQPDQVAVTQRSKVLQAEATERSTSLVGAFGCFLTLTVTFRYQRPRVSSLTEPVPMS